MTNIELGDTYIIPKMGRFFYVHEVHDDYILIGDLTDYYSSAPTITNRVRVSWKYVDGATKIVTIDTIPGAFHNGIGWKHRLTEADPEHPRYYPSLTKELGS